MLQIGKRCRHVDMELGLCDMDKKNYCDFFDKFCDFDFNHDFDTRFLQS